MNKNLASLSSGIVNLEKAVNQKGMFIDKINSFEAERIIDDDDAKYHNAPAGEYFAVEAKILIPRAAIFPSS